MAELALGVLGVVPLIGGAIKTYKQVHGKLKLFRHCSKEVKKVHKVLRIQRQVFANECRLWLRFVRDDDEVASEMASDPGHDGWDDPGLEASLQSRLKDNYEAWLDICRDICGRVDELEASLDKFKPTDEVKNKVRLIDYQRRFVKLYSRWQQDGRLKKSLKRTQDGAKIVFNFSDFEKTIDQLRLSNNQLKELREQISELHRPKPSVSVQAKASKRGDWASLIRIRRASKALHEALVRTWNCGHPGHMGHAVKLFVETHRVDGEVQLNLAIVCRSHIRDMVQSTLVQLEVRSQNLEWIEPPQLPGQLPTPDDSRSAPRKRLKVVRFAETIVQTPIHGPQSTAPSSSSPSTTNHSTIHESCDLSSSKDICRELTRQLEASCLGHLDVRSDEAFRHSFYPAKSSFCGGLRPSSAEHKTVTMDEVLDESSRDFFSTVDRLKLARSLVSAVLKFHSTPWLGDFWRLRDLAFFRTDQGEDVSQALRSLHVGVEVAQRQIDWMEGVQSSSDCPGLCQVTEDQRLFCGIDNLTLHSLGVALLQIDRWTRVEPGDVLAVRKMALRGSSLGPRYQEITQKCLRCDFGYGSDLTKPRLQEAVYESVVGALEMMISSLDLAED